MSTSSSAHDVPFPPVDEALGEHLQPNEAHLVTEMADTIEAGIRRRDQPGSAHRDVHAKATGIVKAKFSVSENIPPQFAKGVFIPGKTYDAIVRFSNASGEAHQSDNHQDGRGFAIKLLGVPGPKLLESDKDATTQDFVMINHPFFFTNDAKAYVDVLRKSMSTNPLDKLTLPFSLGLRGTINAGILSTGKITNPLQIQYYSAVPYQLGLGDERIAVKYSIKPVSTEKDPMPHEAGNDYLHQAVKKTLTQGEVQYRFMIQPKMNENMKVEDSTKAWCEKESPFQEVATITFPKQDVDSEELNKLGERLSFNPWHALPEHKPLGAMNRARKVVYERISRVRDSMNSVPREEPSSGRGGQTLRGKSNSTKVAAPLPVNLPSRRLEKGHDVSLVSSGSSWGSPSTQSPAVLGSSSSTASSPAADGNSPLSTTGASSAQGGGGGDSSPQLEANSSPSFFQKTTPRAWGVVAQTPEQHLDEYPTAAEAAKKTQELHDHQHHAVNGQSNSNSQNQAKRTPNASSTTSGEPMAKTVSAISSGGDNWDEAEDDGSVDFLKEEAIEFADGSVVVAAASAPTTESSTDGVMPQTTTALSIQQEEKVIDRGDVDFNRSWPSRASQDSTHRYPSHDRPHPPLWQGPQTDRRPSVDRTQYPSQRRESFGSRENYQSGSRRESLGPKDSFPGTRRDSGGYRDGYDRRDAGGHRDSYDRRDSYNRSGSYSRDREPPFHRDGEFNRDRRPSHDRPIYPERFSDRHQRDFQLLTRPKEGPHDRLGPQDAATHQKGPHPLQVPHTPSPGAARGPQEPLHAHDPESRVPSYAHLIPAGAVEYDRPAQVTEDQREAMKHAAEEARKRREEEEKRFEEARARARARADELAKKAEEEKLAKEKEEAAAKEAERAAKAKAEEEEKEAKAKANEEATVSPPRSPYIPESVRDFGDPRTRPLVRSMTETERQEALAQWQALPEKLAKEKAELVARVREVDRLEREQKASKQAASVSVSPPSVTPDSATSATVGPWRRSGQKVNGKKDDGTQQVSARATSDKDQSSSETTEQLDKVMHRIEERLNAQGLSVPGKGPKKLAESPESTAASATSQEVQVPVPEKAKTRNGKASRADKDAWRKTEPKGAETEEKATDKKTEHGPVDSNRFDTGSKAIRIGKGNYPAKLNGVNGVVKVSDISGIHARLARQTAGDLNLEPAAPNQPEGNSTRNGRRGPGLKSSSREESGLKSSSREESKARKSLGAKRNSLSNSITPTIFPSDVEQAAKKRGSMSFMVESEIDGPSDNASSPSPKETARSPQWKDVESAEQTPINLATDGETKETTTGTPSEKSNGPDPSSLDLSPVKSHTDSTRSPGTYPINASVAGVMTPMGHMWSATIPESTPAGTTMTSAGLVMTGPMGTSAGHHPVQQYPVVMPPYYAQGYAVNGPPMYYMYPGAMPHIPQYAARVIPTHASMSVSSREGLTGSTTTLSPAELTSTQDMEGDSISMGMSSISTANDSNGNSNNSTSILGSHHWLPRFSAAGDAPSQQVGSGGSFLVPVPVSQQASMIAAANINRAPQPRPYGHHHPHPPQHLGGMGSGATLENSFRDGSSSPTSTDGWGSGNVTMTTGNTTTSTTSPSNSSGTGRGNHHHSQNPAVGLSSSSSLAPGTGRMSYGNYQSQQQSQLSSHSASHPTTTTTGHRGGRGGGGFHNSYGSYREFKPRGGYGGGGGGGHHGQHAGQHHHIAHTHHHQHATFQYGHGNVSHSHHHQQQHGSAASANTNSTEKMAAW
ncbi:hypothetical protein BGX28_008208 [Mortierella sp. GBA30]|nr:hypothetical protein BGX28_008208 [Mortierella sp. GBA30]